jgi:nucleoside-diphosphate-sugar epimerase
MNLLVGATGFVGGHVVEYLFQQNEISKGIFRKGGHLKIMDLNGVQGIEADILDHHSLHEAMEGVDTVYSMASPMPGSDSDFIRVNTEGITNLLEVSLESKVKSFVHLSTLDVYGSNPRGVTAESDPRPGGDYQKAKLEADRILLEHARRSESPRITIIRAARAVGSRDSSLVVPLLRMIEDGSVVLPASGVMSFSHPRDVAEAMYKAATGATTATGPYLVKSFDATPEEFARRLSEALERSAKVSKEGFLSASSIPSYAKEQLKAHLRLTDQIGWSALGYAPKYDLPAACNEIAQWYKKNRWATELD